MRLAGKIAVITGAASGIGLATTRLFLAEGAKVLGADIQPAPADLPGNPAFREMQLDLTEQGAAGAVFDACRSAFGDADILFNNAGIGNARPILETDDEALNRYVAVNFVAPFKLAREAVRIMRGRGGAIINTASVFGMRGAARSSAYGPTKAAMIGMTQQLAVEYAREKIRVNAIAPGAIVTPMTQGRMDSNPWFRREAIEGTPMLHAGTPEDIAAACLFLASDEAKFITGVTLPVDGGWSAAIFRPDPATT
jgi:NAD(P)-dependent dehydrogenase (short-subunit alcohol dehydrogenase family)